MKLSHPVVRLATLSVVFAVALVLPSFVSANHKPGHDKGGGPGSGGGPGGGGNTSGGFTQVKKKDWDETKVRKVLHAFAFGGLATGEQIATWAGMRASQAVAEILSFDPVNEKLSPPQDDTANHAGSLKELQLFWGENKDLGGSMTVDVNPVPVGFQDDLALIRLNNNPITLYTTGLQNAWVQAATTRGVNPVVHHEAFRVTNYQGAILVNLSGPGLMQSYYDDVMATLTGSNFIDALIAASSSAALSLSYGHRNNRYRNDRNPPYFSGNDDFARELHQLVFGIQGERDINGGPEDPLYHEEVTIEGTARVLTGMAVDRLPGAYGTNSNSSSDQWVAPINFADHTDAYGNINNTFYHHAGDLEIHHNTIVGATAGEKIAALARVVENHPEALDNIPQMIVEYYADDNLTDAKLAQIRGAWRAMQPKNLLDFLRAYAASTTFHSADTFKYRTAFDRNLTIHNLNVLSNEEAFVRFRTPRGRMSVQGANVFIPVNAVFGGQTGLQAANNPNVFKDAYNANIIDSNFLGQVFGTTNSIPWIKDWVPVIPSSVTTVDDLGLWLWERFVADGGKNYDAIIRAQTVSVLATGYDLGYALDEFNPNQVYSSDSITDPGGPIEPIVSGYAATGIAGISGADLNKHIGLVVNLITVTPYTFVLEGL